MFNYEEEFQAIENERQEAEEQRYADIEEERAKQEEAMRMEMEEDQTWSQAELDHDEEVLSVMQRALAEEKKANLDERREELQHRINQIFEKINNTLSGSDVSMPWGVACAINDALAYVGDERCMAFYFAGRLEGRCLDLLCYWTPKGTDRSDILWSLDRLAEDTKDYLFERSDQIRRRNRK